MAHAFKIANASATAEVTALAALMNNGSMIIYDSTGTGQPADADTAVTTQQALATFTIGAAAAASFSNGVATMNIPAAVAIAISGTATWYRVLTSGGAKVCDGTVGVGSGYDCNVPTASYVANATASITSWSITQGKS